MKKAIITSATIVVTLGFMLLRDYHNYFYGKSFINYHLLPYGLTPEYYKDYVLENGKSVPIESIDSIKSYYYNKDSIFVYCVDEENRPHWIIPVREKDGWVVFDEIKNVQINNLAKYKCVSDFYD